MVQRFSSIEKFLLIQIAFIFLLRTHLAFVFEINWDEFYFLSHIYQYQRGELTGVFQTSFVHLFTWLPLVGSNEVDQVILARLLMLIINGITAYFLYKICRLAVTRPSALLAIALYFSFSFIFRHGASFRSDPMITCLLIYSVWLVISPGKTTLKLILAGALIGLAGSFNIKSVLYAPLFGVYYLYNFLRAKDKTALLSTIKEATGLLLIAAGSFVMIYIFHKATLPTDGSTTQYITGAASKTFSVDIFPQPYHLNNAFVGNLIFIVILCLGAGYSVIITKDHVPCDAKPSLHPFVGLGFCLVLLSLIFYRNSFPYFYLFALAPCIVVLALGVSLLESSRFKTIYALVVCLPAIMATILYNNIFHQTNTNQKLYLSVIHKTFPEPVSYFDRSTMVASFPKKGFFMSTWGIENYVENRIPVFKNIVELEAPAFLLENSPLLSLDESENTYLVSLLAADQHILNENYLPFWGRLRVLGKSVTLSNEDTPVSFQIFREGHYTNKDMAPVIINEQTVMPGEALYLTKGVHTARSTLADQHLRLLWGENLSTPSQPAPDGPIFTKF